MIKTNINKQQKIFFVGIGGKGLNGIAKICLQKGYEVCGVDTAVKPEIDFLKKDGIKIYNEHSINNIDKSIDLIVYTSLMTENCPELIAGKQLGIKMMKRSKFLGQLTKNDFRLAISGSHGKSTTTAILGLSLINAGVDATIFGGAYTREFNGYNHLGKTKYTVIESCEFDRSFFDLVGDITILTSVEKNHLEYYKDEREMKDAFAQYFKMHSAKSLIVANGDDLNVREVTAQTSAKVKYFGFNNQNDYIIKIHCLDCNGSVFSIVSNNKIILEKIKINLPGRYNIQNFVACAIVIFESGLPLSGILQTAHDFYGVGRRFETRIAPTGQILIDDFAHHPTQVKNLFEGIRQFYPNNKVYAVFQPNRFNLLRNFLIDYGKSFVKADEIILTDILARSNDTDYDLKNLKTDDVYNSIKIYSQKPILKINDNWQIYDYLRHRTDQDSVIATIGSGDIYKVRDLFLA